MPFKAQGVMAELFLKMYGGLAGHTETIETIGTTRGQVLNNNPERTSVIFVNVGGDFITITPSNKVPSGDGIRLGPNGGFVSVILPDDAPLPTNPWFAVADSAANSLYIIITERVTKLDPVEGP